MAEDHLILEHLRYIASQQRTVTLISNFRGVPIQLAAHIVHAATNGLVRLCINHRQIIALKSAEQALVKSDLFAETVIARIEHVDLHTNIVTLSDLRYVTNSMGNRKNVRVQPESPIHAEIISSHGYNLKGEVIDISLGGLSVRIFDNSVEVGELLPPQTSVEVRLGLPGCEQDTIHDLAIQAKVAYTRQIKNIYRVGMRALLEGPDIPIIRRYIFDRQTEILNEIRQMNQALLKLA